ncbi:MAG: hypothetical protein QXQ39_03960 [Conexivisphaerales archaeon]
MRISILWYTPSPEKIISLAMRRCYSTKPVEEILKELDQKGPEYWRHLLELAFRDKSFDVIEHFYLELLVEGLAKADVADLAINFPFMQFTEFKENLWLVLLNARTLIELWYDDNHKYIAESIVREMKNANVAPIFVSVAFAGD